MLKSLLSNKHSQKSKIKCFPFIFQTESRPVFYMTVAIVLSRCKFLLSSITAPMNVPIGKKMQVNDLITVAFYGKPFLAKDLYNGT